MKKFIAIILLCLTLTAVCAGSTAVFSPDDVVPIDNEVVPVINETTLEFDAKSAILIEAESGEVLYEKSPDIKLAPASVTKIMTLLLIMEAIDSGKIKYTDVVTCSEHAASMGGSQVYLEPGEKMTVDELLKAITVASGNDASVMMAEYISGSHETFVDKMNERARELGMENTNFVNCTGLEDPNHRTTARDIAIMSRELLKHEGIFNYTTIWMDTLRDGKFGLANTNKLIRFYEGANGLKTGSTDTALFCLSASAKRNNMQLISVVLGSKTSKARFAAATKLLDYGFANYAVVDEVKIPTITPTKVIGGIEAKVIGKVAGSSSLLVKKGKEKDIEVSMELADKITAPVEVNQIIGKLVFTLDGEVISEKEIYVDKAIRKANLFDVFKYMLKNLL